MAELVMDTNILKTIFERHKGEQGFVIVSWDEFNDFVSKAYPILVNRAKQQGFIKYGEVGGKIGLFVDSPLFRSKIGIVVGTCSEYEFEYERPLISAIVVNDSGYPGRGFWGLPGIPINLHRGRADWTSEPDDCLTPEMIAFWATEVKKVFGQWKGLE